MSGQPAALQSKTAEKIAKINTQLRLLWPQYDPDLNTKVDTVPLVRKYIKHAYKQAAFSKDHENIEKEKDLDRLITEIFDEGNKAPAAALSSARPGKPSAVVALS